MRNLDPTNFTSRIEELKLLSNLLELALYASDGEVTIDGKSAMQNAARRIALLSSEASGSGLLASHAEC